MHNSSSVTAILLGLAQDAGVPQIACRCDNCLRIDSSDGWPVALALIDNKSRKYWIIDATPRFVEQFNWLSQNFPAYQFSGILLTHAHIGHYTGLMHLGREAMSADSIPVYASLSMQHFLSSNGPWSGLVELSNISFITLHADKEITLSEDLKIKPVAVTHRSEYSNTFAFLVNGPDKTLFYCPDVDHWQGIKLESMLKKNDYALLDGTFYSAQELVGRNLQEIPHPLVTQTIEFIKGQPFQTWIIHLNHSNPLWCAEKQKQLLNSKNIRVANFGHRWQL